jgi:prefoldin alpha subunit
VNPEIITVNNRTYAAERFLVAAIYICRRQCLIEHIPHTKNTIMRTKEEEEEESNEQNNSNRTIQLDSMSLDQLDQLQRSQEQRLNGLTTRYAHLRQAAARLSASETAIRDYQEMASSSSASATENSKKKEVLVPLTESVYVTGSVAVNEQEEPFLVDLGTGYYCTKTASETIEFIQRKMQIVDTNSDHLTQAIQTTRQNLDAIATAIQGKMMQIQARQQGIRLQQQDAAAS